MAMSGLSEGGANSDWAWLHSPGCHVSSEEALFRRCSAVKAQTRRGSVFQAAEVVMKVGGVPGGVSVSRAGGGWRVVGVVGVGGGVMPRCLLLRLSSDGMYVSLTGCSLCWKKNIHKSNLYNEGCFNHF